MTKIRAAVMAVVFSGITLQANAAQFNCTVVRYDHLIKTGEDSFTGDYSFNWAGTTIDCKTLEKTKSVVCWDGGHRELQLAIENSENVIVSESSFRIKDSSMPEEFAMKAGADIENYSPKMLVELTCRRAE